jgi:hypothetical protein
MVNRLNAVCSATLLGVGRPARLAGLALLGLSFGVGAIGIHFGLFVDEGGKLAGGWLITQGEVLYRDVFSHHQPLTYYWLAGVFALLGPSVLAARLSMLFFNLIAFAVLMRATRQYGLVGVAALGWGAFGHVIGGQMALYNTLAAASLAVVLGIGLAALASAAAPSRLQMAALGGYAALAVLADITLAPGVLGEALLLALHRPARRRLPLALPWIAAPFVLWAMYLLATGSAGAAYDSLVRFNAEIYPRYYHFDPATWLNALARTAAAALYIWKPAYWQLSAAAFGPASHITELGRWLFGGFLFRVAVLLSGGALMVRRHWLAALLVYGLAVLTATRAEAWFRL